MFIKVLKDFEIVLKSRATQTYPTGWISPLDSDQALKAINEGKAISLLPDSMKRTMRVKALVLSGKSEDGMTDVREVEELPTERAIDEIFSKRAEPVLDLKKIYHAPPEDGASLNEVLQQYIRESFVAAG